MHFFTMYLSLALMGILSVFAQNITTGQLGNAPVVNNNPTGASGAATLPNDAFWTGSLTGNIQGNVTAVSGTDGKGVDFSVTFSNLPKEGGPFLYHIHVDPVDAQGNCTNTLAHLDPFARGEDPLCDPSQPSTCQVGDLSGKYGAITADPFTATFHDDYTSMQQGMGSYFLNRSVVVHFANKTRITCASFVDTCESNTTIPLPTTSATMTPVPTGGAGTVDYASMALAFGSIFLAAVVLL